MSDFSAAWLDLREPVDHRSRNRKLERALAKHFDGWRPITVVDLGCGTGSNLRAIARNPRNIIAANKLGIRSRTWARVGIPLGLVLLLVYFAALFLL